MSSTYRTSCFVALACLGAIAPIESCRAASRVEVTLGVPEARDPAHPAVVTFELRNAGDAPVSVLKWQTPFVEANGRLANPQFRVKDAEGTSLRYTGFNLKFVGPEMTSYMLMMPGETLRKDVDLIDEYDFSAGGDFTVSYELSLDIPPDPRMTTEAERRAYFAPSQERVVANPVTIHVDAAQAGRRD